MVKWVDYHQRFLTWDEIHKAIPRTHELESSYGWCFKHPQTTFRYNPTVPARTFQTGITSIITNLENRWGFKVYKVYEYMEISPTHPNYASIIRTKQELITRIKEGLAGLDRAVSDIELLAHDARRYREILDYYAKKDEHSLKALFIDYVDANLPEGISMKTIAIRWPTIIADFQALTDEDDTVEKVMKKLKVSKAEAVVLATKVKLYKRWKDLFLREVKERYKRIRMRLEARKKSLEEYRDWLRPLVRRVWQMREVDDHTLAMHALLPAGAGYPYSLHKIVYWAWTKGPGPHLEERHKPPREVFETEGITKFRVEPYDEAVKRLIPKIEEKHGVKITKEDILEARKRLAEEGSPSSLWYILIEIPAEVLSFRLPTGLDVEDIDFNKLTSIFLTQNAMLVRILEIIAEEKRLDAYIDELLGGKVLQAGVLKDIEQLLAEDLPEIYKKEGKEVKEKRALGESFRKAFREFIKTLNDIFGLKISWIKGPYDPFVKDRIFYGYGRVYAREVWGATIWPAFRKVFGGVD